MEQLDVSSIVTGQIHRPGMTIPSLIPDSLFFILLIAAFAGAAEFYAYYIGFRKKAMSGIAIGAVAIILLFAFVTHFRFYF
jgi:hypothetical protein